MEQLLSILRHELPLELGNMSLRKEDRPGLLIVDEVNGFCTVGAGNLAPTEPNKQISDMVHGTNQLAKDFSSRGLPILVFLETHEPNKPEPPYPPHCVRGTGEEKLVPELQWLEHDPCATFMEKDCINGFIAGFRPDGSNAVVDWVAKHKVEKLMVVGICTDVCVMDFVLTALSARNHGILQPLKDIVVFEPGCSTYHLPRSVAEDIGRGHTAAHPQELAHHMGLSCMYSRGATLVKDLSFLF